MPASAVKLCLRVNESLWNGLGRFENRISSYFGEMCNGGSFWGLYSFCQEGCLERRGLDTLLFMLS